MVHLLLKPGLENLEHYFTSMWDECSCVVVWAFFGISFLRDWIENWPFTVLWALLSFTYLLAYWVQHFHSIIFQDLKLIRHKKEHIWVSSNDVDEHTEWSKSERERYILYSNTYTRNLEKWYWKNHLQSNSGERHREYTYRHGERRKEGEMYGMSNMETYITIFKINSQCEFALWLRKLKQRALYQHRGVVWGWRWEGNSKGRGYMYTYGWFMLRFDRK